MASTEGLVPITRAFLSSFYDKFPFPALSPEVLSLDSRLQENFELLARKYAQETGNDQVIADLLFESPHKIDENFWKNREQIEEILFLLDRKRWPSTLKEQHSNSLKYVEDALARSTKALEALLAVLEDYQSASSEKVFSMILTYMPQDFRGTLIKQQRDRSEKRRQAEVETLINNGGTIGEKFGLLWKQQMDRRNQLAMLGSASGVYKTLLTFLVGVPQVLLDFVRKINDHNGPMEEQRHRYGPPLYELTQLGLHIRVFLDLWWKTFDSSSAKDHIDLLEHSVKVYYSELARFIIFLREVFDKSPFLISADEAGDRPSVNEFKEVVILAGKTHEAVVTVDIEGSFVAWDFSLTSGKDVGFSVEYTNADGIKMPMFPYQRHESDQGSFSSPGIGSYKLVWDNSYSTFYKKNLRYKVDAIPPVPDAQKNDLDQ